MNQPQPVIPLVGDPARRLQSDYIDQYEAVFPNWHGPGLSPRFGDERWQIAGADPVQRRRPTWTIDFSTVAPEWSLIIREVIYWRANLSKGRRYFVPERGQREWAFKAQTIAKWHEGLRTLAGYADELGIGLPNQWHHSASRRLRALVVERTPHVQYARHVKALHTMSPAITGGGISFDPTRDTGVAAWAGDTASHQGLAGTGIDPSVFHSIVGNALTYVEQCADDILEAIRWRDNWTPRSIKGGPLSLAERANWSDYPDVTTHRAAAIHQALVSIGGIPTSTVPKLGSIHADRGEPCHATLRYAARVNSNSRRGGDHALINARVESGTPLVAGGLPISISNIDRPDGTTGPWRDAFCAQSIDVEAGTLQQACKIVVMAFTAMRDSELEGIPKSGWRTTWHGADAITSPLIKNAQGEPMKWWATPPVILACEILEQLADPSDTLLMFPRTRRRRTEDRTQFNTQNWKAVQDFIRRLRTDPHLHGFLEIKAGWRGGSRVPANDDYPSVTPRNFRFTLASISNFVALGDVAFQQQAKHAAIAMSHSYAANGGTSAWRDAILNTVANDEAQDRAATAVDLFIGAWTGDAPAAGHAGRHFSRTVKDLLAGLPPYDPDAEDSEVEQFTTRVLQTPELLAAIRATAAILHPGDIAHCLRYTQNMECSDKAEPIQGLCHPETCSNVLLDESQQEVYRERLGQVTTWLGMPRIPEVQREVLIARRDRLTAQLRIEEN